MRYSGIPPTGDRTAHVPHPDHPGAPPRTDPFDVKFGLSTAMQVARGQFIRAKAIGGPKKKK